MLKHVLKGDISMRPSLLTHVGHAYQTLGNTSLVELLALITHMTWQLIPLFTTPHYIYTFLFRFVTWSAMSDTA
jgi:hypothetical protein